MIAAPFGSLALQLSPDLRIVTKITPGSETEKLSPPLYGDGIRSNRMPQLKQVLKHTDATDPDFIRSVCTRGK